MKTIKRLLNYPLAICPMCNNRTLNCSINGAVRGESCVAYSHFGFGSCDYQDMEDY